MKGPGRQADVELVDVTKLRVEYCTGCASCYRTGGCHIKDDYLALREKLLSADGIILSSPNYIMNITAQLKTFLDRSANFVHEQYLDGKYGFSIMTAGGDGEKEVLGIMNRFMQVSGGTTIGGVGHLMFRGPEGLEIAIKSSSDMGRDLVAAIKDKRVYPEQAAEHAKWKEHFANNIKANKDNWKHNYERWVEMGWI